MNRRAADEASPLRLAVLGAPGAGKHELLRFIALRKGVGEPWSERLGDLAYHRVEWTEDALGGDEPREVIARCIVNTPVYQAANELLVRDADAMIFLFDVREAKLKSSWLALQEVAEAARRSGFDFRDRPLVLQYHRGDMQPGFDLGRMDAWLGVPPDARITRVATSSDVPDGEGEVLAALWSRLRDMHRDE